jgi:hypothetical protein
MGPNMNRKLDIEKVESALQRAAQRALHGTRAERSGRFLPASEDRIPSARRTPKHPGARRRDA